MRLRVTISSRGTVIAISRRGGCMKKLFAIILSTAASGLGASALYTYKLRNGRYRY